MGEKLDVTQPRALAAQKAPRALGCIPSSVAGGARGGGSAPLPRSAETPLQRRLQLRGPQHKEGTDLLERGQRRPRRWPEGWSPSAVQPGWERWGCSARRREGSWRAWSTFQHPKRAYKKDGGRLFSKTCSDRTRGNGVKIKEGRFRLDIRKKSFTMRVVRHWHRLPREVVDVPSLETFKAMFDGALSNLI